MTVGRTEKKKVPEGWKAPRKSYGDDMRENLSTDGTVRGGAKPLSPLAGDNAAKPVKRHKIGKGSYEDPSDEKRRSKKPKKTGRPGR